MWIWQANIVLVSYAQLCGEHIAACSEGILSKEPATFSEMQKKAATTAAAAAAAAAVVFILCALQLHTTQGTYKDKVAMCIV